MIALYKANINLGAWNVLLLLNAFIAVVVFVLILMSKLSCEFSLNFTSFPIIFLFPYM